MNNIAQDKVTAYKKKFTKKTTETEPVIPQKSIIPTESTDREGTHNVSRDIQPLIGINFDTGKEKQGFPYTYLTNWRFTEEKAIELKFSDGIVLIIGKNLETLYSDIQRFRVNKVSITENNSTENSSSIIDSIQIKLNREKKL